MVWCHLETGLPDRVCPPITVIQTVIIPTCSYGWLWQHNPSCSDPRSAKKLRPLLPTLHRAISPREQAHVHRAGVKAQWSPICSCAWSDRQLAELQHPCTPQHGLTANQEAAMPLTKLSHHHIHTHVCILGY